MNRFFRLAFCACLALASALCEAVIPQTINYQGNLTTAAGTPVSGPVMMTFRIYNAATGGSAIYAETQPSVGVANGSFNAVIGAVTPLALAFDVPYWLSVAINTDAEMSPRQPMASSAYAFRAAMLDSTATISGAQVSGSVASADFASSANIATQAMQAYGLLGGLSGSQVSGALTAATIPAAQITGTIAGSQLAATQRLPTVACAASEIAQWNGSAWICAAAISGNTGNITGNLTLVTSTATTGNILKDGTRFVHNFGDSNTFIGLQSGNFSMTGNNNTGSGAAALASNTSGFDNTASGTNGLLLNKTGNSNTAIGSQTLTKNDSGSDNTAIGSFALYNNLVGNNNIALGSNAGVLTKGSSNIVIGHTGVATESSTIRVGNFNQTRTFIAGVLGVTPGTVGDALLPVVVAPNGQFGTLAAFPPGPAGPTGPQGPQGPAGSNDITGNLTMVASTPSAGNILKGGVAFIHNFGARNTFIGQSAGNFTLSGTDNTASGWGALTVNSSGYANTAGGAGALYSNSTGDSNTANGFSALRANLTGTRNTASGAYALSLNESGGSNTASGVNALLSNSTGNSNTAIGLDALTSNTTGGFNTAIGKTALAGNTTGDGNIAIGFQAGVFHTTGSGNIAIGNAGAADESSTIRIGGGQTRAFISGVRGITPAVANPLPVVIDSNGQLGTGAASASGVTSVATGAGLSGGPITTTGTISLASTQLLPTVACSPNQVTKWNGSAWLCAADNAGAGTVTSITAGGGLTGGTITGSGIIGLDPNAAELKDNYFKFGGNVFGAIAVLGSANNVPINVIANGARAVQIEPTADGPNIAMGHASNVAGGVGVRGATVSGGGFAAQPNLATALYATVGGGINNKAQQGGSTVSGGSDNTASGNSATVGGGVQNTASVGSATVSGGIQNTASGGSAAVGGGLGNTASGGAAAVAGGNGNVASGQGAMVPGGIGNSAIGSVSFAAGYYARANVDGCFVWADGSTATEFQCNATNRFMARASGGVDFRTNSSLTTGCSIAAGGGAWACTSSRETKTDFAALNPLDVLDRVAQLPLSRWRYRDEISGARHVGPMAEDFHAAFGLGDSDKSINVLDASGVALTAIQGLNQLVGKKDAEIQAQNKRIKILEDALAAIQSKLGMR